MLEKHLLEVEVQGKGGKCTSRRGCMARELPGRAEDTEGTQWGGMELQLNTSGCKPGVESGAEVAHGCQNPSSLSQHFLARAFGVD